MHSADAEISTSFFNDFFAKTNKLNKCWQVQIKLKRLNLNGHDLLACDDDEHQNVPSKNPRLLAAAIVSNDRKMKELDRQRRSSSFQESKKVRVSRDLWPWPWPWAHPGCTLTWSPSCASLVAIRPFAWEKKWFAQKFTDGQTDGRTDDGRRAIALAHSWNELKNKHSVSILCLLLGLLLIRVFHGIHDGWLRKLEQVFVEDFFRQWFRDVVGIECRHRRMRLLLENFVDAMFDQGVVDACKTVHRTRSALAVNVQNVVLGVDPPYLSTTTKRGCQVLSYEVLLRWWWEQLQCTKIFLIFTKRIYRWDEWWNELWWMNVWNPVFYFIR